MDPETIVITGGAGFVGSNLALHLKRARHGLRVVVVDNLRRRGSELHLPRLKEAGVEFVHGDVRNPGDLDFGVAADILLECSAEPSVMASFSSSPEYVIQTNLVGTLNLLEYCRRYGSRIIFLSTSRVYPIEPLCSLKLQETTTRFEIADRQEIAGISSKGVTEAFPLAGARSLYGATKLASELFIEEYGYAYGVRSIINRCGVIAGPWQMGKVDQGFVVFWLAQHVYGGKLTYIGFNGSGRQVRDVLHIDDLCELIALQIARFETLDGQVFNVGGGRAISVSLLELTQISREVTGKRIPIEPVAETRPADIPIYLSDCSRLFDCTGWQPTRGIEQLVDDVQAWLTAHQQALRPILTG